MVSAYKGKFFKRGKRGRLKSCEAQPQTQQAERQYLQLHFFSLKILVCWTEMIMLLNFFSYCDKVNEKNFFMYPLRQRENAISIFNSSPFIDIYWLHYAWVKRFVLAYEC